MESGENVLEALSYYCWKKKVDISVVYVGRPFDINEGNTVRINNEFTVQSKLEYIVLKMDGRV